MVLLKRFNKTIWAIIEEKCRNVNLVRGPVVADWEENVRKYAKNKIQVIVKGACIVHF
jgi:hypothetical protein